MIMRTSNEPDRVIDHIHALPASNLQNLLLPPLLRVVHAVVRAAVLSGDVELLLRARCGDDLRTKCCVRSLRSQDRERRRDGGARTFRELHGGDADASRGRGDQDPLA